MNSKTQAIGVFDSGMGGLTVLAQLQRQLPNESFIYLGDTARLPYGTKSTQTVQYYAKQMTTLLLQYNIKLLVIACNTASAAALPFLQQALPNIPIIGVIQPSALAAIDASKNNNIAVLATESTVRSAIYEQTIQYYDSNTTVISQACGLFVALAEEGCTQDEIALLTVKKYLQPILNNPIKIDCILLGCTHFPVLSESIKKALPKKINIVNSAYATAHAVKLKLEELNVINTEKTQPTRFLVTDLPERFIQVGHLFLGKPIQEDQVKLVDTKQTASIQNKIRPDVRKD